MVVTFDKCLKIIKVYTNLFPDFHFWLQEFSFCKIKAPISKI